MDLQIPSVAEAHPAETQWLEEELYSYAKKNHKSRLFLGKGGNL
jgi:hypothetical protein